MSGPGTWWRENAFADPARGGLTPGCEGPPPGGSSAASAVAFDPRHPGCDASGEEAWFGGVMDQRPPYFGGLSDDLPLKPANRRWPTREEWRARAAERDRLIGLGLAPPWLRLP